MADQVDKCEVKAGRLIVVRNQEKEAAANEQYFACWVEDPDGGNERCLLFTASQLQEAQHRADQNPEDLPEKGFLTDLLD